MIIKSSGETITNQDAFGDDKTDKKIHRHLSDINDVISEEDIRNVKTEFDATLDSDTIISAKNESEIKGNKNEADVEVPSNPVTPWDVVK